jgi:hypothetical protein
LVVVSVVFFIIVLVNFFVFLFFINLTHPVTVRASNLNHPLAVAFTTRMLNYLSTATF